MSPNSIYELFDPTRVGWLHRKVKGKEIVTASDLARIGKSDPDAFADPVYQEQVLLGLEDGLEKPRGRPREDPLMWFKTLMADVLVEDRTAVIRAKRKASGTRGPREPRIQAAEEVARYLRMHMTPETLLNRISATKRSPI